MLSLQDRDWDAFYIGDYFAVTRPAARNKDDYSKGDIPFVASGANNNGVMKYCTPQEGETKDKAGCITVSPVDGTAFYQPIDFLGRGGAGSSVLMLRSEEINEFSGLFVAKMISVACSKYTYGHMGNAKTIVREQIMLPIDTNGKPDWAFMDSYIRERKERLLNRQLAFLEEERKTLRGGVRLNAELYEVREWASFYLVDIFDKTQRGKRLKKADHEIGDIPYVSSTALNNGVDGFITKAAKCRTFEDCISLNNSGSVGKAFYEPFEYVASDHVTHLKKHGATEEQYLFLATAIEMQAANFSFNREINDERLNRMQVMLPVGVDGKPDWDYMDTFGKLRKLKKIDAILAYLNAQRASLKKACLSEG